MSAELVLGSSALAFFEIMIVCAIATLFSSFSSPFLTAVFTFGVFLVGREADTLARLPARTFGQTIKQLGATLSRVVPNLQHYVPPRPLLTGEAAGVSLGSYLGLALLQAGAWAAGCWSWRPWSFASGTCYELGRLDWFGLEGLARKSNSGLGDGAGAGSSGRAGVGLGGDPGDRRGARRACRMRQGRLRLAISKARRFTRGDLRKLTFLGPTTCPEAYRRFKKIADEAELRGDLESSLFAWRAIRSAAASSRGFFVGLLRSGVRPMPRSRALLRCSVGRGLRGALSLRSIARRLRRRLHSTRCRGGDLRCSSFWVWLAVFWARRPRSRAACDRAEHSPSGTRACRWLWLAWERSGGSSGGLGLIAEPLPHASPPGTLAL